MVEQNTNSPEFRRLKELQEKQDKSPSDLKEIEELEQRRKGNFAPGTYSDEELARDRQKRGPSANQKKAINEIKADEKDKEQPKN